MRTLYESTSYMATHDILSRAARLEFLGHFITSYSRMVELFRKWQEMATLKMPNRNN